MARARKKRCVQVAANGRRCGFDADGDSNYCRRHQPVTAEQSRKPVIPTRTETTARPAPDRDQQKSMSEIIFPVVLFTIIFFPIALIFLWRSKSIKQNTKIVGSIAVVIVALFLITNINRTLMNTIQTEPSPRSAAVSSDDGNDCILGSTKSQVVSMFRGWDRKYSYENRADPDAIKFEKGQLMAVIDFTPSEIAEGVAFLSFGLTDLSAKNCPTHRRYDELVEWATCGREYEIYVPTVTTYPAEIYIGDVH